MKTCTPSPNFFGIIKITQTKRKKEIAMKKDGYYSSGEFARMAHVTLRTIRYYDKQQILKPSYVTPSGARFYTEEDFARLQQILLLKYLGFSLEDIRQMTIEDSDYHFTLNSLKIQRKLINDRIEQMQMVETALQESITTIEKEQEVNWGHMLHLIHLTSNEDHLRNQYHDASNLSARMDLHRLYSNNKTGWFPWIYDQCHLQSGMQILELGCGDGTLWHENLSLLPKDVHLTLSDLSEGMIRDARRTIDSSDTRFSFEVFDCHQIPLKDNSMDLIIANHVLFYLKDLPAALSEICRVLSPNGRFLCSTYGCEHMKEITHLVQEFDARIVLSADTLYQHFGRENGATLLAPYFSSITWHTYEDCLLVPEPEPLISYILSCHGNQLPFIRQRYPEFRNFVKRQTTGGFTITKDAGIFECMLPNKHSFGQSV
jgi:DNA-binding transcriptional MerR regulator/ubiquinone/menaquinone biosynthesis C-methylase UbiE